MISSSQSATYETDVNDGCHALCIRLCSTKTSRCYPAGDCGRRHLGNKVRGSAMNRGLQHQSFVRPGHFSTSYAECMRMCRQLCPSRVERTGHAPVQAGGCQCAVNISDFDRRTMPLLNSSERLIILDAIAFQLVAVVRPIFSISILAFVSLSCRLSDPATLHQ